MRLILLPNEARIEWLSVREALPPQRVDVNEEVDLPMQREKPEPREVEVARVPVDEAVERRGHRLHALQARAARDGGQLARVRRHRQLPRQPTRRPPLHHHRLVRRLVRRHDPHAHGGGEEALRLDAQAAARRDPSGVLVRSQAGGVVSRRGVTGLAHVDPCEDDWRRGVGERVVRLRHLEQHRLARKQAQRLLHHLHAPLLRVKPRAQPLRAALRKLGAHERLTVQPVDVPQSRLLVERQEEARPFWTADVEGALVDEAARGELLGQLVREQRLPRLLHPAQDHVAPLPKPQHLVGQRVDALPRQGAHAEGRAIVVHAHVEPPLRVPVLEVPQVLLLHAREAIRLVDGENDRRALQQDLRAPREDGALKVRRVGHGDAEWIAPGHRAQSLQRAARGRRRAKQSTHRVNWLPRLSSKHLDHLLTGTRSSASGGFVQH
mmetsp:Transcript_26886/g.64832  ORF Transcript_26886/g.64832 Transcript_26886/m.64832 type:complete len:437 (-) Transcript_26886:330-1640(-)